MGTFDEAVGKTVTRRAGPGDPVADAAILLDTIARLCPGGICPKGVWRFRTFDEADRWALSRIANVPAPRV